MKLLNMLLQIFFIIFHTSNNIAVSQNWNSDLSTNNILHDIYENAVIECIVSTSYKYIPCGTHFTLVSSTYFIDGVNSLLSYRSCYTFLSRSFETRKWKTWTDVYIFYTKNYQEIYISFTTLSKDVFWNSRAVFFVVVDDLYKSEYSEVFNILLNHNIFNVLLITKSNGHFTAYKYHAFDEGKCGQSINKIEEISDCRNLHSIRLNYTYLENKLRNCTITVAAFEDMPNVIFQSKKVGKIPQWTEKGLEQYIIDNIAQKENLTIKYIYDLSHGNGVIFYNFTVTGVLSYLHNNTASVVIGGFALIKNRIKLFEYISGYCTYNLCLFTPASVEETWKKVYQEFGISTWLLIGLTYIFAAVVITLSRRFLLGDEDRKIIILKIWGYLYGQTDIVLIKTNKMKKIVIFWIWFTFFMTSFYNSALSSLLTRTVKVNTKIDTTSLSALPWEPCISDATRTFYKFTFNETFPGNTNANCKLSEDVLDTIANNVNYFGLDADYTYQMRKSKYVDENGNSKINSWHYPNDLMHAMYTTRGFPLHHKFQKYTTFHFESGLLQRQRAKIYHQLVTPSHHYKETFKILRLSDFRIHYAVLIIGYTVSLISFIIELSLNKVYYIYSTINH
uniref:Ionotropic receptor 60a2b n=1 Tax=Heliconius melpomene rosina TaxID=171916 RepID=A0A140G9G1_HELME|nr:ionotropic receptor 60a2b [Heliconius melpomene rosina]